MDIKFVNGYTFSKTRVIVIALLYVSVNVRAEDAIH